MTKKDLFRLIIKVFGLYSTISSIFYFVPNYTVLILREPDFLGIVWLILALTIIIILFLFLIFKPDSIIKAFRLDKGFDENRIEFQNFGAENIVKLAIVLFAGMIIINNIPTFLSNAYFSIKLFVQQNRFDTSFRENDYIHLATSGISMFIGYLLLTNYNAVAKFLVRKEAENQIK
ncbi:MAG: hypothetical protein AB7S48_14090 [Bacteroidales bacterium]